MNSYGRVSNCDDTCSNRSRLFKSYAKGSDSGMSRPRAHAGPCRETLGKLVTALAAGTGTGHKVDLAASAGVSLTLMNRLTNPGQGRVATWKFINKVEAALPVPSGLFRLVDDGFFTAALALDYPDQRVKQIVADVLTGEK